MNKIEKVARALCKFEGKDPDALYQTGTIEVVSLGHGAVGPGTGQAPQWQMYSYEARRFITAYDVLEAGGDS
jgi:hypothetical protein